MKITIQVDQIHYEDIAIRAISLLERVELPRESAAGKILAAVTQLPEQVICSIFDAIPMEQKHEIVAALAAENKEKLLGMLDQFSQNQGLGVSVSDLSVDQNLTVTALVDRIDYACIFDKFLPLVREKLLSLGVIGKLMFVVVKKASAAQLCELMDRFNVDKDAIAVSLVNQNRNMLTEALEAAAQKQGIRVRIRDLALSREDAE